MKNTDKYHPVCFADTTIIVIMNLAMELKNKAKNTHKYPYVYDVYVMVYYENDKIENQESREKWNF
ncbi:hypothetical protein BEL04_16365 [Mucilaginibacter sp. PPCGB 2223]|uniref:hypothetical protein n=1 Tax=Mucilaginibacter sp. PPCGB 2223 TaxID=1886027 RepID=UPI000824CA98|nr:hypothetical protein [Mucilaginibacter sp. PPCGB 2223]OCX51595.1 hypothetical protein BEL04_16365 [Mucilaginibacter sp. PPCGB 2223]